MILNKRFKSSRKERTDKAENYAELLVVNLKIESTDHVAVTHAVPKTFEKQRNCYIN